MLSRLKTVWVTINIPSAKLMHLFESLRESCTRETQSVYDNVDVNEKVHGGSHCAVEKEAKRAMHIDYNNLPRPLGRLLKLKLVKRKSKLYPHL